MQGLNLLAIAMVVVGIALMITGGKAVRKTNSHADPPIEEARAIWAFILFRDARLDRERRLMEQHAPVEAHIVKNLLIATGFLVLANLFRGLWG